jgi:phage gp29-like protein
MDKYNISTKSYLFGLFKNEVKTPIAPKKSSSKGIITQLVQEFQDRSRKDIQIWREAMQAAENPENPRWSLIQDLYDDLMTDGHLMANIQIRKAAVLSNRFFIQDKEGNENEETSLQLQTEWFYHMLEHMLDAIYKGYTVLELADPTVMRWENVPRRNVCPQKGRIYFEVLGDKFIEYRLPAFIRNILEVSNITKFGILNDIVPQLIWKRNAQQVWADFSERFGIPMVTAETMETDSKKLDKIEDMLSKLGQAAQAVLPEGTKITIHDSSTKGDPHNVFNEQIKTTNGEISKRIVGGTMISDDGSSRSQSEVHERTLDFKIAESDRRLIEFTVNNKLIPILNTWGFKFADGDKFVFDRTESLTLMEQWEIVSGVLSQYDVDEEWIARNFNIPILAKKQQPTTKTTQAGGLSANFR